MPDAAGKGSVPEDGPQPDHHHAYVHSHAAADVDELQAGQGFGQEVSFDCQAG